MKFLIETYGCQMNAHDSEKLSGMLKEMGHIQADTLNDADLIIFNTCCVRKHAEERVYGNIGALKAVKDEYPELIIGVCGCMMQQKDVAKKLLKRYQYVNFAIGTHSVHLFPDILLSVQSGERVLAVRDGDGDIIEGLPIERSKGITASLNIMYGCDNYCSYCIVPYVRGRERSRASFDIINEARALVDEGYTEIMLLGQNVNSYGAGTDMNFSSLLRMVSDIPGLKRIRFMTSHPKDLSDELIEVMAERDNICDHLHLPVQAGNDRILKLMNRKYMREDYLRLVDKLRTRNQKIELTTDIIVGFPSETEEEFSDTLSLVNEVGFSSAFTFMYSIRTGTSAANMEGQLPLAVKKERLKRLNALQAEKTIETNMRYIGMTGEVLIEGCDTRQKTPMLFGKLSSLKPVYFPGEPGRTGEYANVLIERTRKNSLIGTELTPNGVKD